MSFFYVRNDGTATGDGGRQASQQTGDWDTTFPATTSFYSDIQSAIGATTPPVAGDFILCSSIHAYVAAGALNYDGLVEGVTVLSVDDTAIDNQLTGASETTAAASSISLDGSGVVEDVDITATGSINFANSVGQSAVLKNLALTLGTTEAATLQYGSGRHELLDNVDIDIQTNNSTAAHYLFGGSRARVDIRGGSTLVAASNIPPFLYISNDDSLFNVRDHTIDSSITTLVNWIAGANNNRVLIENCEHSATTILSGSILDRGSWLKVVGFNQRDEFYYQGDVHRDTATYITADGDKDGVDFSYKMVSNANTAVGREPLRMLLWKGYVDTSTAKTFTIPILWDSVTNLTDAEFYTEVVHQDDTTDAGLTETDRAVDIFNPTDLAADTNGKWTEAMTNDNEQKSVVTTALTGKAGEVEVWVNLAKASTTVYVGTPVIT